MTDPTATYACTLDEDGARARLPQATALTARLRRRQRTGDRLVLEFDDVEGTRELVDEFVRDESRCCSFFGFEVRLTEAAVLLELSAPSDAGHMLDAAMAAFDPAIGDQQRLALHREHAQGTPRPRG